MSETVSTNEAASNNEEISTEINQDSEIESASPEQAGAKAKAKPQPQSNDEDYEEVKVGAVKGKVTKEMARMIKSLEQGFQSKAKELSEKNKLLELAKTNPKEYFKQTGQSARELAEQILIEEFEEAKLSPEQKRLRELEAKEAQREEIETMSKKQILAKIRELVDLPDNIDLKKFSREQLEAALEEAQEGAGKEQKALDQEIGEALSSHEIRDPYMVAKTASLMLASEKQVRMGMREKPLKASEAAAIVKKEWTGSAKNLLASMSPQSIEQTFGKEFIEKIRQYVLEQATGSPALNQKQNVSSPEKSASKEAPTMNEYEYRQYMKSLIGK